MHAALASALALDPSAPLRAAARQQRVAWRLGPPLDEEGAAGPASAPEDPSLTVCRLPARSDFLHCRVSQRTGRRSIPLLQIVPCHFRLALQQATPICRVSSPRRLPELRRYGYFRYISA